MSKTVLTKVRKQNDLVAEKKNVFLTKFLQSS